MTGYNGSPNPTSSAGGGQPTTSALVGIDTDVQPVWETEALPDWVVHWLIPMLSAGQKWPEASESGLSKLAHAYAGLGDVAVGSTSDAGTAARTVVAGWAAPSTAEFVSRAKVLYGHEGGLAGASRNAHAYAQQSNDFAVETQYSKISINVAFWVTVVAIAIALVVAFFSAGASTAIIGPYAAAARAAISRIIVRLATIGGRSLTAARLARVTSLSGATGQGAIARLLASSLGRELVEEIGEEFFIDAAAQYQQIRMGTRKEWDWKKSQAAILGAGTGAVVGTRLSGPMSRVTSSVPGFAGRALTTGATNMIASPVGSFVANGAVYGQWQNPFTADSLMGGFLGGAGRTGTISPFNPDVFTAVSNPISTLASAYDAAARADAARMGGDPSGGPAGGNPSTGGPSSSDDGPSPTRTSEPAPARAGAPAASGARSTTGPDVSGARTTAAPDTDSAPARRAPDQANPDDQNRPDARTDRSGRTTAAPEPTGESAPQAEPDLDTSESTSTPDHRSTPENTGTPDTATPDTAAQNTAAPDTTGPETAVQNTTAPDTTAPDTTGPDTAAPDTTGQPATDPDSDAETTTTTTTAQAPVAADPAPPGPSAQPAAAQDPGQAGAYTSRPGTVTSRPVPGTRYVTDGRQGPDLTLDEVRAATGELLTDYFLDGTVTGVTWSDDGTTLVVRTKDDGIQYFRPKIGLSDPGLMARTDVRRNSTDRRPHQVRFNPRVAADQLARVWLHEITDTLQELRAGGGRGILRRRRQGENTRDDCVVARLNELEMLADKWRQAPTMPEKRLLAIDIDGVARRLRAAGHPTPQPPWAPTQATRPQQAPPLPSAQAPESEVRALVEALTRAEEAIGRQIKAKTDSAEAARKEAVQAARRARKARKQHDQGRFERARKARQESRTHRATHARHLRIAQAYGPALAHVTEARKAYEQFLAAARQAGRTPQPGEVSMADIARSLATRATRHHQAYLEALAAALPQEAAYATAMPTGGLAHLSALTTVVNDLLERNGAVHRFTTDGLERALRADFHKLVTPGGVVLRVGRGRTAAEVRVELTLSDLAEVIDAGVKASEMMVGLFFQAARTVSASETSSGSVPVGFNTAVLAQMLPEGEWPRAVAELLGVGIGVSAGRNRSATGGAGMYAQGGSVADNRSESLLFDAAAKWTVEIRTGKASGWRDTTVVDSGAPGDPGAQRLWFSHSYTDQPPSRPVPVTPDRRGDTMPNVVIASMTELDTAFDRVAAELGGAYTRVGTVAREQLHAFIADELPHRLRDAVNTGVTRVLFQDGKPHASVRAESWIVLEESELIGGPTAEEWEEEVLVDFVAAPGGASSGGSLEGNVSAGFKHPGLASVDGPGDYSPTIGPQVRGSRSKSRSYSATANKQAIHPSVHRKTSRKQAYKVTVKTRFVVEVFGKAPVELKPITSTAVMSMRESAARDYGLPFDRAALVYENGVPVMNADGKHALRGDPRPGPPPGRKAELPEWLGEGQGRMRGAGPALVQEIEGLDALRQRVMDQLADQGLIPKIVDGRPRYAGNELARAAQILNLQEVTEQLSEHRIRSAYDSLAQDGILVDLVRHRLNGAPQHFVLRVSLKQDFAGEPGYVGYSDSETVVNLEIGSDTSARAISRSRTYGGGGSVSVGDGPEKGHDGLTHEVGVQAGGNRTRTVGSSVGGTVNVVTLQESTGPVAIFKLSHELSVELVHDGKQVLRESGRGTAKLLFATDLLPPDTAAAPAPLGDVSDQLRSKLKPLHMDVPGLLAAARKVLPYGMREDSVAFQKIMAALNVRNLVAHAKLLTRPLVTALAVRTRGVPTQSSLTVAGNIRDAEVVAVVDQVNGDILFGLGSAGVSWGGSSGISTGGSRKGGDLDDGGTTSDSGSFSGPTRSGGTAHSTSVLDIWGTEELTIDFGRQYIVRAAVDLTLTGSESAASGMPTEGRIPLGEVRTATAQGTGLFTVPEFDALLMYAQGRLSLPGVLVGDAIERLLNGGLTLDQSVAVPLVQRYVMDVTRARAAGEDVSYADRHTPAALLTKLHELTGLGEAVPRSRRAGAERRLAATLSEANDLIERSRDVVVAPAYDRGPGVGSVNSITLVDDRNNPVDILDAVQNAVRAAAPQAVTGAPNLMEELSVDFSGDAARIHVVDMMGRLGYEKSYHVQAGPQVAQAEELTVTARLVYADPADARRARFVAHTSQSGTILQHYRYLDRSHSESYNGSHAVGLEYSADEDGDGHGAGLSTDRGRSYTGGINQQETRLQRQSRFNGRNLVTQVAMLEIVVTRTPMGVNGLRGKPTVSEPVKYTATIERGIPTGMIRPADQDPGPVTTVPDPRRAELRPGFFTETLWEDPDRPSIFEVAYAKLTQMLGARALQVHRSELVKRLQPSAVLTAFERMTSPDGHVERVPGLRFKHQGAQVRIRARTSDLTIVAGPFDGEKGQVNRQADAQNVTVSRSRVLPVGESLSGSDADSGVSVGGRAGEQASESVSDHHGARRERSGFEKGKLYTVRFRVDYDLTFEHVARLRNREETVVGDPVHLPSAVVGEVDVTLLEEELAELIARMEAGVRLAPPAEPSARTFAFVPGPGRHGLIQVLGDARLAARERGMAARVAVREGRVVHRYVAETDGTVRSEQPDGAFAEAFTTLSPPVLNAASRAGVDLRDVFLNSEVSGTFTQQVMAELRRRGVLALDPSKPAWPADHKKSHAPVGGSVAQGWTGTGGAPAPALENTIFDRQGRPDSDPDLTLAEVRAQGLFAGDLDGARLSWAPGGRLTVQAPGMPAQHVLVLVEDPGPGLNGAVETHAGTADDPHVMRLWQRIHPQVVSSVLVHELSHVAQAAAAAAAGAPQGVLRPSAARREGDDLCLTPRLNEHAHLSRKWRAASDPAVRADLGRAIDAVAADLERRGHTPPAPPWAPGARAAAAPPSRIAQLINGPAAVPPGGRPALPEAAAADAVRRAAAFMGAEVRSHGPGALDILTPGRPPIRVEIHPPGGRATTPGALAYQVDAGRTIGANERAAAATVAEAIARARGQAAADHAALAELREAVRQVRAATAAQRPGRLGVLHDLVTATRPEVWRLVPEPVAAQLATLADGPRPRDWAAHFQRLRALADTTGWYPPEQECRCPEGEPCTCGRGAGAPPPREPAVSGTVRV
ncbi:hypothetical protein [Nonomuraea sp. NPDC048826]|uniref:WXG100-like domain-containing protein n=1 Tax=Nonomuraea sp. NPDC048826 TaxID=3364347 RepID=UPI00371E30C6